MGPQKDKCQRQLVVQESEREMVHEGFCLQYQPPMKENSSLRSWNRVNLYLSHLGSMLFPIEKSTTHKHTNGHMHSYVPILCACNCGIKELFVIKVH